MVIARTAINNVGTSTTKNYIVTAIRTDVSTIDLCFTIFKDNSSAITKEIVVTSATIDFIITQTTEYKIVTRSANDGIITSNTRFNASFNKVIFILLFFFSWIITTITIDDIHACFCTKDDVISSTTPNDNNMIILHI